MLDLTPLTKPSWEEKGRRKRGQPELRDFFRGRKSRGSGCPFCPFYPLFYPQAWCDAPSSGATVWYFSYITDAAGGYFNFYVPGQNRALVVTMAYRSKNVNALPSKGSTELDSMLSEMASIVNSLKIKRK
jgi:hypothetical protein